MAFWTRFQADGTAARIEEVLKNNSIDTIVFTGMGSSYFMAFGSAIRLRNHGYVTYAMESNELLTYNPSILGKNTLLVAVSQSGKSAEVLELMKHIDKEVPVLVVTNEEGSPLCGMGAAQVILNAEHEDFSASKSYTNTLLASVVIESIIDKSYNPEEMTKKVEETAKAIEKVMADWAFMEDDIIDFFGVAENIACIGSGAHYATACQSALIITEAAKSYGCAYTLAQFLHGPLEKITSEYRALVFDTDDKQRDEVKSVINSITGYGGKALVISNNNYPESDQVKTFPIAVSGDEMGVIVECIPMELMCLKLGTLKGHEAGKLTRTAK